MAIVSCQKMTHATKVTLLSLSDTFALKLKIIKTWHVTYQMKEQVDVHQLNLKLLLKYDN